MQADQPLDLGYFAIRLGEEQQRPHAKLASAGEVAFRVVHEQALVRRQADLRRG
jgi:hypothetical protein